MEKKRIEGVAAGMFLHLYHIGSTAVPALDAKPTIDLLMTVYDFSEEKKLEEALGRIGYEALGSYGIEGRRFYTKGGDERSHHVHVFVAGDPHVLRHLAFRDYLRAHPKVSSAYGRLKRDLAHQFPEDIDAYCDGKREWISRVEREALAWIEKETRALLEPLVAERVPLPEGKEAIELTESILRHIGSLDPTLRDGMVYPVVGTLIQRHLLPDTFLSMLTRILRGSGYLHYGLGAKEDPSVFRRSFSLLLLTEVTLLHAEQSLLTDDEEKNLVEAVVRYIEGEVDRRGYDDRSGWAHSIAHSGDAIGALAGLKATDQIVVARLMDAITMHFSDEHNVLINEESERIISGLMKLRTEGKLDDPVLERWLKTIEEVPDDLPYPQKQYREENLKRLLCCLYFRLDPTENRTLRASIEKVLRSRSHFGAN